MPQTFHLISGLAFVCRLSFTLLISGVAGNPAYTTIGCIQAFEPNGTTSVTQLATNGKPLSSTTIINRTPLYAPCGPDWTTGRDVMTFTVANANCTEVQIRDEPRLTSLPGEAATFIPTCLVSCHYTLLIRSSLDICI